MLLEVTFKKYLLDTNHCCNILNPRDLALRQKLSQVPDRLLSTCVIVAGEMVFMGENSEYSSENLPKIKSLLQSLHIYPIDSKVAENYGQIKSKLIKKYGPKEKNKRRHFKIKQLGISDNDLWIASVAIANNLILVSQDADFDRIKEVINLQTENWLT